jgi:hypothetical protein
MNRISLLWVFVFFFAFFACSVSAQAQQASPGITSPSSTQATPANVIAFSDSVTGQSDGAVTATFALYPDQQSTAAAWTETQVVLTVSGVNSRDVMLSVQLATHSPGTNIAIGG